ncbi:MAG: PDZ domain-containing protein [Pyrinomonadaceae bacterium]
MSPEPQRAETFAGAHAQTVTCPSCRADMMPGMRFCRLCGYRLGEGVAEYAETVRLGGTPFTSQTPFGGQTAVATGARPTTTLSPHAAPSDAGRRRRRRCGGGASWLTWVLVAFIVSGATGSAAFVSGLRRAAARAGISVPPIPIAPRSFLGVNDFDYVRGEGVMLDAVLPGSPAENAGLRDGDLIQRFDGKNINSEEDMRDQLRRTPIGKTVEVAYTRDGTARTTMLKTISPDDYDTRAFLPAGGTGYWGVSGLERVPVESGDAAYGVKLGSVSANRPADIAGLERGDIIVSFNGNPVRTTTGLASYIDYAAPGSVVSIGVIRNGQRIEVPVKNGKR